MGQVPKQVLRKQLKGSRLAMRNQEVSRLSQMMASHLWSWVGDLPRRQVFGFVSLGNEPDLLPLWEKLAGAGCKIGLPVTSGQQMSFYRWCPGDELIDGDFGIKQPKPIEENQLFPEQETLIVVPALGVDASGHRLGFGAGFYDRFLASHQSVGLTTVAAVFERFLQETISVEDHDVPVDFICTEARIFAATR